MNITSFIWLFVAQAYAAKTLAGVNILLFERFGDTHGEFQLIRHSVDGVYSPLGRWLLWDHGVEGALVQVYLFP